MSSDEEGDMSTEEMKRCIAVLKANLAAERDRSKEMSAETTKLHQAVKELQLQTGQTRDQLARSGIKSEDMKPAPMQVQPMYISTSRKVDRFRDKPVNASDITIQEWVEDVRVVLTSRKMRVEEQAAFVVEHLAGKARQEILGRGDSVKNDPERIFTTLLKVFGDGDSLAVLQQKFFSYQQKEREDLLTCSLGLVDLYDRICQLDRSYVACRDSALKGRLAEAVRDESLRRELRRLNIESPLLSFFDVRDRAIEWLGQTGSRKSTVVQEVSSKCESGGDAILELLKKQTEQLKQQQQQINDILSSTYRKPGWGRGQSSATRSFRPLRCFRCNATDHFVKDCPITADDVKAIAMKTNHVGKGARAEEQKPESHFQKSPLA